MDENQYRSKCWEAGRRLSEAINTNDLEVIQNAVDSFPTDVKCLNLEYRNCIVQLPALQEIVRLFPQMDEFRLPNYDCADEVCAYLLRSLRNNKFDIKILTLPNLVDRMHDRPDYWRPLLVDALKAIPCIQKLRVDERNPTKPYDQLLMALGEVMQVHRRCFCDVDGMYISNMQVLADFLKNAPRKVRFDDTYFYHCDNVDRPTCGAIPSHVEELHLVLCAYYDDVSEHRFPTEMICNNLRGDNSSLVDLSLQFPANFGLDHQMICDALQTNTTLVSLHLPPIDPSFEGDWGSAIEVDKLYVQLLERHNTTLTYISGDSFTSGCSCSSNGGPNCSGCSYGPESTLRWYYLALNYYGRKHARDSNTSLATLVQLLSEAPPDYERNIHESSFLPHRELNILHGLLRESTSIWCPQDNHLNSLLDKRPRSLLDRLNEILPIYEIGRMFLPSRKRQRTI